MKDYIEFQETLDEELSPKMPTVKFQTPKKFHVKLQRQNTCPKKFVHNTSPPNYDRIKSKFFDKTLISQKSKIKFKKPNRTPQQPLIPVALPAKKPCINLERPASPQKQQLLDDTVKSLKRFHSLHSYVPLKKIPDDNLRPYRTVKIQN